MEENVGYIYETGHPWITFKDAANLRSPQQHWCNPSSNLCTEITLNTQAEREIAVCNLGSVNLANHLEESGINSEKLKRQLTSNENVR